MAIQQAILAAQKARVAQQIAQQLDDEEIELLLLAG